MGESVGVQCTGMKKGKRGLQGPELIQELMDKSQMVRRNLKAAQDRQRSFVDPRRREVSYNVGDRVFLNVSPWKGVAQFGRKGKLSPRYIGPYEVIERVGPVAYRLALPIELPKKYR